MKRLTIKAKPKSKTASVVPLDESTYQVSVKEPPQDGKANQAVIRALGEYFDIPQWRITIVSGKTSRTKVIEIE